MCLAIVHLTNVCNSNFKIHRQVLYVEASKNGMAERGEA